MTDRDWEGVGIYGLVMLGGVAMFLLRPDIAAATWVLAIFFHLDRRGGPRR